VTAADVFRSVFDREPSGVWSAPGRVNLIGEHTDYNGGYVLPFAIDRRTAVAAARRDDDVVTVRSLQRGREVAQARLADLAPGRAHGWPSYIFGTVWALRETGYDVGGLDIVLDGGVPSGSGLSSSAAIECSVGLAVLDLHDIDIPLPELARLAQFAENNYVGVPCGLMDQMAVSVCQADHALFFDTRDDVRTQEPFAPHDAGLSVLVINTRAQHAHAGGEYAERRRSCEAAAQRLGVPFLRDIKLSQLDDALRELDDEVLRKRTRHVVTENDRVLSTVALMRQGKLAEIGPLLTESHASLRDDFEVSCTELDVVVDATLAAGAIGARMTGGGFGGSAIALVPSAELPAVEAAVADAFRQHDFVAPELLSPAVSSGVAREARLLPR